MPRKRGETPVRYAGRFDKKEATNGAEVTGVSSMPMNGSPFKGCTTCNDSNNASDGNRIEAIDKGEA